MRGSREGIVIPGGTERCRQDHDRGEARGTPCARHGKDSLALVTTDAYRIGAHRQLQTFGQILGVPVHLAETGRQLGDILSGLGDKQRIFVDTAGMSQRDLRLMEEIAGSCGIPRLRRSCWWSPPMPSRRFWRRRSRAFGRICPDGPVLTKVDEAVSLGPVLSALSAGRSAADVCQ
jgi:flagellar biosynthesis protein FlhF